MIYINKKNYILIAIVLLVAVVMFLFPSEKSYEKVKSFNAIVIGKNGEEITVRDEDDMIYTFAIDNNLYKTGDSLVIQYTGLLDDDINLVNILPVSEDEVDIDKRNDGMFSNFTTLADKVLEEMSLDEKIGQLLLVRYVDDKDLIKDYHVGGFVFFEKDFKDKSIDEVSNMMKNIQGLSKIPLLMAVDEEGGDVVRVSSNKQLIENEFLSPRQLYLKGGFDLIKSDTITKSDLLEKLGLNVNLAPVVDVSVNSTDYMYNRTLGEKSELVSEYAKTVIEASLNNKNVSYVLKHFPGYGNNDDTHNGVVVDTRSLDDIKENDLAPFEAGISSGAEAILVNHNIVQSIDPDNPATLSSKVHNLLRNDLDFTGVVITDDLSMGALSGVDNAIVKAVLAGNDIIITSDYEEAFMEIKKAVEDGIISENLIDDIAHKIISWKYYKGLMYNRGK